MSVGIYEPIDWQRKLGYKVNHNRCRAAVWSGRFGYRQCAKKQVRQVDGVWFCGTHAKLAEKEGVWR